jgi:hypothetical protein
MDFYGEWNSCSYPLELLIDFYFPCFCSFFDLFHLDGWLYICSVVIMEGDPHPGAINGRMSFQSFNPSIDVSIKVM